MLRRPPESRPLRPEALRKIWKDGKTFTIDLLGEAAVSEVEADRYRDLYLSVVDILGAGTLLTTEAGVERITRTFAAAKKA